MKRPIAALAAIGLAIGLVALAAPMAASAHTGDLNATAVCNTSTGEYAVTYTLTVSNTDEVGTTNWIGIDSQTFQGIPTSNGTMTGAVVSHGSETITLGTLNVPGTHTHAPWAYAFTTWVPDGFTKGSDGGNIDLAGDCKIPPVNVPILPVTQTAPTCDTGVTYTVPTQDARVKYALLSDGVTRPAPGTFSLGTGQSITVVAHVTAEAIAGGAAPGDYSITVTGADKLNDITCHAPQACVVTGTPYTEDGFPAFTVDGQDYEGGTGHALNWLVPTSGNLQGFTSASFTVAEATGYQVAYRFVLFANGASGYTSVSAEPYLNGWVAGQTGVFTVTPATLVWNSHILSGPGSQGSPVSITDMAALIPANQLISQGIHYGSTEPEGASTVVSAVTGCVTFDKPTAPDPIPSITTDNGEVDCSVDGGGSYVITTHHFLTQPLFVDGAYTFEGAQPTPAGEDTYQTIEVGTDVCPAFVTPEPPTATCGGVVVLPGVVDGTTSETENADYSVTSTTPASITVTADPVDGFQFNAPGAGDSYTLSEGSAVWVLANHACSTTPPVPTSLATTGVDPALPIGAAILLLLAGAVAWVVTRKTSAPAE